jgi:hypothetical protein
MKKMLTVILIVLFGSVGWAFGQTANDAYLALKKMEAKTQVGISYRDYAPALAEAKFAVDRFTESKAAKKNPELSEHLGNALILYIHAKDIFELKLESNTAFVGDLRGELVRKIYPKAIAHPRAYDRNFSDYNLSEVLSGVWGEASKEIKKASFYLKN